jgi:hypothetical protein
MAIISRIIRYKIIFCVLVTIGDLVCSLFIVIEEHLVDLNDL